MLITKGISRTKLIIYCAIIVVMFGSSAVIAYINFWPQAKIVKTAELASMAEEVPLPSEAARISQAEIFAGMATSAQGVLLPKIEVNRNTLYGKLDMSVLENTAFQSMKEYAASSTGIGEMGKSNPFKPD